jgi:NADH-quinone oxidoreductase subunit M
MAILDTIGYGGWVLHFLVWAPLVGMAVVLLGPVHRAKEIALGVALLVFLVSVPLWFVFNPATSSFQFVGGLRWIPDWGINYRVGVDGISILLILLTTFIMPLTILGSFRYIADRQRTFYGMMLLLQTGIVGVFVALDLFLFFVFWELMLVPMYFIIGIWGGERRIYASLKFFIYTMAGSLLMLVAIIYLGVNAADPLTGVPNFSYETALAWHGIVPDRAGMWLFLAFFAAFAVKVPMFPFHTWLPDAHTEAPTAGSVILAGIMLKMGTFGFIRFALPLFPEAAMHPTVRAVILTLAVVGIIYGALVAMVQPDFKRLVAYSSVSHLGFVMLGVFALTVESMQGAVMVMINHGISTGALFFLVGMIYERKHSRMIDAFGGIARVVPMFAALLTIVALSSIGVPGTNGFIGEFLVLAGSFRTAPILTLIATTGVIFAAAYLLWAIQRILFNPVDKPENLRLTDLNARELAIMAPLVAAIIWMGVYPAPVLRRMETSARSVVELVSERSAPSRPTGVGAR